MLDIVVQTAVDGVAAECGRAVIRQGQNGTLAEAARAGNISSYMSAVRRRRRRRSRRARRPRRRSTARARPRAAATGPRPGRRDPGRDLGRAVRTAVLGARARGSYLTTNQAAISIENVDLHEAIQRQAVTDELTGLFNHRRFREVMSVEVERTRRFGQELGLIMLDIDNFKRVNDTYGHLQGDMVLREVARVLRESSREIDEPARYGGEEMAALPQTGLQARTSSPSASGSGSRRSSLPLLEGEGRSRSPLPSARRRCHTPRRSTRTRSSPRRMPRCTERNDLAEPHREG